MNFDYSSIPEGYYDHILYGKNGLRKFWHFHKFDSVLRYIPIDKKGNEKSILDVGCFAGSFLGMIDKDTFGSQYGIDILPPQIAFAQNRYGSEFRKFELYDSSFHTEFKISQKFDIITLIEVIEHLDTVQIKDLLSHLLKFLKPDGRIIITTPNYFSFWPVLEFALNLISDVKYEEQHLTKFRYFDFPKHLQMILGDVPLVCEKLTTTHFLSPFVAPINYSFATKVSDAIPSSHWKNPFGCIILSSWKIA